MSSAMAGEQTLSQFLGLEIWLTPSEKDQLAHEVDEAAATEVVREEGRAAWTVAMSNKLARRIPDTLTPNFVISVGVLFLVQAWRSVSSAPSSLIAAAIAFVAPFSWLALDGLVRALARVTLQDTAITRLWHFVHSSFASMLMCMIICEVICSDDNKDSPTDLYQTQSAAIQVGLLFLLSTTLTAERTLHASLGTVSTWPTTLMLTACLICMWFPVGGPRVAETMLFLCHTACFMSSLLSAQLVFHRGRLRSAWRATAPTMVIVLWMRNYWHEVQTVAEVFSVSMLTVVLTCDILVARTAGRALHPWVVVMMLFHIVHQPLWVTFAAAGFYFVPLFLDLSCHMNLPILAPCKNVYCDGVYDLCHLGHKKLFKNAAKLGHRLFVGVCNDKDCSAYKRPPIMKEHERAAEILACKSVSKVIPNAPCFGLKEEFIRKHRIHSVAFGEEYQEKYPDPDLDPYYKVPRRMGIAVPMPRTTSISTSEIITRVQQKTATKNSPT